MEGRKSPLRCYLFDLLQLNGKSLIQLPLAQRKEVLAKGVRLTSRQLLNVDIIRRGLARTRLVYYTRLRHELRTLAAPQASAHTVEHTAHCQLALATKFSGVSPS